MYRELRGIWLVSVETPENIDEENWLDSKLPVRPRSSQYGTRDSFNLCACQSELWVELLSSKKLSIPALLSVWVGEPTKAQKQFEAPGTSSNLPVSSRSSRYAYRARSYLRIDVFSN